MGTSKAKPRILCQNRKARHEYEVLETLEAGIMLSGDEVKAISTGRCSLIGGYVQLSADGVWMHNVHISATEATGSSSTEATRTRKLLLHKYEIKRWMSKLVSPGITIIPLQIHRSGKRFKVQLGLSRGLKNYDKRTKLKEKQHRASNASVV